MVSTVVARTSPEDLAVLAYQQRPVQPQGIALTIVVVAISIIVIDICVVGLRVWVRSWYLRSVGAWGMDDTLTVIGFVRTFLPYSTLPAGPNMSNQLNPSSSPTWHLAHSES